MPPPKQYPAKVSFRTTREQAKAVRAYAKRLKLDGAEAWRRLIWGGLAEAGEAPGLGELKPVALQEVLATAPRAFKPPKRKSSAAPQ